MIKFEIVNGALNPIKDLKAIYKILVKIKKIARRAKLNFKGLSLNPFFWLDKTKKHILSFKNPRQPFTGYQFGLVSLAILGVICFGINDLSDFNNSLKNSGTVFFNAFFTNPAGLTENSLFAGQNSALALETPDLKIIDDNCVCGISTPRVLTTKVLGDIFGDSVQGQNDIIEYAVQPGDTIASVAETYDISINTILWANSLTKNSTLKVGQTLVILPVSGLVHIVKSGDTIMQIAKKYKAKTEDIVSFNNLTSEGDIYIGDILVVPNGTMPQNTTSIGSQVPVASSFFINPTEGQITQSLHWYNAVDIANKCGTPVYAAAAGTVQRVMYGYNAGGGNYITILHSGGIVTYYGHLMTIFAKPGDVVSVGDRIALMGGGKGMSGAGISTGCHLHFDVRGAKNPFSVYYIGSKIKYTK